MLFLPTDSHAAQAPLLFSKNGEVTSALWQISRKFAVRFFITNYRTTKEGDTHVSPSLLVRVTGLEQLHKRLCYSARMVESLRRYSILLRS